MGGREWGGGLRKSATLLRTRRWVQGPVWPDGGEGGDEGGFSTAVHGRAWAFPIPSSSLKTQRSTASPLPPTASLSVPPLRALPLPGGLQAPFAGPPPLVAIRVPAGIRQPVALFQPVVMVLVFFSSWRPSMMPWDVLPVRQGHSSRRTGTSSRRAGAGGTSQGGSGADIQQPTPLCPPADPALREHIPHCMHKPHTARTPSANLRPEPSHSPHL